MVLYCQDQFHPNKKALKLPLLTRTAPREVPNNVKDWRKAIPAPAEPFRLGDSAIATFDSYLLTCIVWTVSGSFGWDL